MFFSFLLKIVPFTTVAALAYGVFSVFLHENARRKEREYLAFAVHVSWYKINDCAMPCGSIRYERPSFALLKTAF